jgi:hypothetical protein
MSRLLTFSRASAVRAPEGMWIAGDLPMDVMALGKGSL